MKLRRDVFQAPCPLLAVVRAMTLSLWPHAASWFPALYPPAEEAGSTVGCSP